MDNSKILAATGMKQEELMTIKDGIARAISEVDENTRWPEYTQLLNVDAAMDAYSAAEKN